MDIVKALLELLKDSQNGKKALELLYGGPIPQRLISITRGLIWVLLILGIGAIALKLIAEIQKLWGEAFGRWLTSADEKHFLVNRQRFAKFISAQLEKLNIDESWEDYRFAELEAEVEAEGLRRRSSWIRRFGIKTGTLRRERSLSIALEASEERLVLLEGEPGSGKSVALRHVANRLAEKGGRSWSPKTVIPLYLNLKHLRRGPGAKVDQDLIRKFTLEHLTRVNNRDVERFIEEHFDDGIRNGTWVFLFDSFDEIPDVLSSTDDDNVIAEYSDAIYEFLTTFNACKGIIASRYFRSPRQGRLPRFRILPLSEERRTQLIRRAGLKPQVQREVFRQLGAASLSIRQMANNPMFLGLLCEFVRDGRAFPDASHAVFERYVERRLWRDADKLADRFAVTPEEVRFAAEIVAFAMAADDQIGLNPTRREVLSAIERLNMRPPEQYHELLTALEYIKLGRGEEQGAAAEERRFTFAHRRFQEYFCTCVVLRSFDRVTPAQLLTEPRWRDTAVVLMQTQEAQVVRPLLEEAKTRLLQMRDSLGSNLVVSPGTRAAFRQPMPEDLEQRTEMPPDPHPEEHIVVRDYPWPKGCLHVLGILQDGLTGRPDDVPSDLRDLAALLTMSGFLHGRLSDKKVAIEIAGVAPASDLLPMVAMSMYSGSQWLGEAAYTQVTRLEVIPPVVRRWIVRAVLNLAIEGRLRRQWQEMEAFLLRLPIPRPLLDSARLILWSPGIDAVLCIAAAIGAELACGGVIREHQLYFATGVLLAVSSLPLSRLIARQAAITRNGPAQLFVVILLGTRSFAFFWFLFGLTRRGSPSLHELLFGHGHTLSSVAMMSLAYCLLWVAFANALAVMGEASPLFKWSLVEVPFLFITRPRRLLVTFRVLREITIVLMRRLLRILSPKTVSATVVCLVVSLVAPKVIAWILALLAVAAVLWSATRVWNDIQLFRKVKRSKALTIMQAVHAWASCQFSVSRVMMIRYVAQRDLLAASEESQRAVSGLALLLERDLDRPAEKPGIELCGFTNIDDWYQSCVATRNDVLRRWGISALDELCRLEQKVSQSRREPTAGKALANK